MMAGPTRFRNAELKCGDERKLELGDQPQLFRIPGWEGGPCAFQRKEGPPSTNPLVFVAHKSVDYVCNGGGSRAFRRWSQFGTPTVRQQALDDVEVVQSQQHLPSSSSLRWRWWSSA